MAQLKAEVRAFTNGRRTANYRLGEDQADAILSSRSGTVATSKLFADGSGLITVVRGGKSYLVRWSADDAAKPSDIEVFADFDGMEVGLAPSQDVHAVLSDDARAEMAGESEIRYVPQSARK